MKITHTHKPIGLRNGLVISSELNAILALGGREGEFSILICDSVIRRATGYLHIGWTVIETV